MKLQKQIIYAIDAVGMITEAQSQRHDAIILTADIADKLQISKEFARNVLSILVKNNVLVSMRGPIGGYRLARSPETVLIEDIVKAMAPKEINSLDENVKTSKTWLSYEICELLYHQTMMLFGQSITDFVKARKAGVANSQDMIKEMKGQSNAKL